MSQPSFDYAVPNHPLAAKTRYGVGGPAKLALLPRTREEVVEAYTWMCQQADPWMVLGGGTNLLIRDGGFPGTVLIPECLDHVTQLSPDRYSIESGVELEYVVRDILVAYNFEGTGGLTGIPGSVGGAIFMNAGTVNGSICQLMETVDIVTQHGTQTIEVEPSRYSYRGQTLCPLGGLILGGVFQFSKAEKDQRAIYEHYLQRRREKQPPGKSCGSVFKNPQGAHSGQLIESCGLKGSRRGSAVISDMHANFIINEGAATCADILALIDLCKTKVHEEHGIALETEVQIVGVDAPLPAAS